MDYDEYWMTPDEEKAREDKIAARRVHYLEHGEYIQEGDEYLNNGKWSEVSYGITATTVCKANVGRYRRFDS